MKAISAEQTEQVAPTAAEPEAQPAVQQAEGAWGGWRRPLLVAAITVAVTRLVLSLWAAYVLANFPTTDLQSQYAHVGVPLQTGGLAAPWQREDALWYEKIATLGYAPNDGTSVFLPLLPLLMRLASLFTLGNVALGGMLVASLAEVAALALLYRLAALDGGPLGDNVGLRAVLYMALFPTAFFLQSAFTESLFLALAIGAFWHARRGRWWLVALLAALAGLTKVQGALLAVPLAFEYIMWARRNPGSFGNRAAQFAAVTLAGPLATAAFFAYIRYWVGDSMAWSDRVNAMWRQQRTWPWETLGMAVQKVAGEGQFTINAFDLLVLLLFAVLAVGCFRLRSSYGWMAVTVLAPSLFRASEQFPLMSLSRYALAAFPCFIVLALWTARRPRYFHLLVLVLWLSLLLIWSSQFVEGFWVG